MSDMSRPRSLPPAADHQQHDTLLVAQFVAGDPLEPERQDEARQVLAGCAACAALAADLPAISRAVAQEPVPPRRRDFRLTPEQAEGLRGNALTRFMRRLSLPRSRAFQPAAAGVLSIGLLLVVAGYAWPEDGALQLQAETNVTDRSTTASSVPAATARPAEEPAAPLAAPDDASMALEGAEGLMKESDFADTLTESQAGLSEGAKQRSAADESTAEVQAEAVREPEAMQSLPKAELEDGEAALGAAADAVEESVEDATTRSAARSVDLYADASEDDSLEAVAATGTETTVAVADTDAAMADDASGPEALIIVLGLALALGGAGLLFLGWLARRARDPLAP